MPTNPKTPQRWPAGQEQRRKRTIESAQDAIEVLHQAREYLEGVSSKKIKTDPLEVDLRIAYAQRDIAEAVACLERIWREMTEAKQGTDPNEG